MTRRLAHAGLTLEGVEAWGRTIGREVPPPLILALSGELGAGKSVFARAVARGAGVEGPVPSPTYNLLFRYPARDGELVHLDLYRLVDPAELWELGWSELGAPDEIVLVEWPERAGVWLPEPRWNVRLERVAGQASLRRIGAEPVGSPVPIPPPPDGSTMPGGA